MMSVHLAVVWNKAFQAMRDADHVVFCGYSFPDADMHVKYLVKRAQLNRGPVTQPLRVTLVNHHPGKPNGVVDAEYRRFRRFLGNGNVDDAELSFEEFVADPRRVVARHR